MALVRALLNHQPKDLELWSWLGSLDIDMLIAGGAVRSVNSAYVGFGAFGLAGTSRHAFAERTVSFVDWSESSLVASFRAGASDLPMALTRALLGTSMAEELGISFTSPYGGPPLLAVPAAHPDIALIHAQSSDVFGNIRRRRPNATDDIDHVIAAAARTVIVSVEEIHDHETTLDSRDEILIPGHHVAAVCLAPQGAHPTGCDGYYHADPVHLRTYADASRNAETIHAYLDQFVRDVSHHDYIAMAAGNVR